MKFFLIRTFNIKRQIYFSITLLLTIKVNYSNVSATQISKSQIEFTKKINLNEDSTKSEISAKPDFVWTGGLGVKSVQLSNNKLVAAACDLEGSSVWLIDLKTNKIFQKVHFDRTIGPGYKDNSEPVEKCILEKPVDCTFSPNDSILYVTLYNANCVIEIPIGSKSTNLNNKHCDALRWGSIEFDSLNKIRVQFRAAHCQKMPKMVAISPNHKDLIVTNWISGSISFIDRSSMKNISNLSIFSGYKQYPRGISFDGNKNLLYVNNMGGGTISQIDLNTKRIVKNHIVSSNPGHHTLSKNNETIFICDNKNKLFYQYNLLQNKVVKSVKFDENALLFGIDSKEKFAVVLHWYHNKISIINIKEMTIIQTINIHRPIGIDFGDDYFLVSSYGQGIGKLTKFKY